MIGKALACGLLFMSFAAVQQPNQVAQRNDVRITSYRAVMVDEVSEPPLAVRAATQPAYRRYIYAHCGDWDVAYANNLLANGQKIGTDYILVTWIPYVVNGQESPDATIRACAEARAMGYTAMPGIAGGLHGVFGFRDETCWYQRETWARFARATIAAARACDDTRRMAVDLEPYGWAGRRYPANTAMTRALIREAMLPWLNVLKALEIKLFVLPGYHECYAYCQVLANEGVVERWCGETTYSAPCDDATLDALAALNAEALAATSVPVLSGWYARRITELPCRGFWPKVGDHWIYIAGTGDDKWRFGQAAWMMPSPPEDEVQR